MNLRKFNLIISMLFFSLSACNSNEIFIRPTNRESTIFDKELSISRNEKIRTEHGAENSDVVSAELKDRWWELFNCSELTKLVDDSLKNSPSIDAAHAALRSAQENEIAQSGFFWPTVGLAYEPYRQKIAGNLSSNSPGIQGDGSTITAYQGRPASDGGMPPFNKPVVYNFHTLKLNVGYSPDIFGQNKYQKQSLSAQTEIQFQQLRASYISLTSNIVGAAIQDALLRRQVELQRSIIAANRDAVAIVRKQYELGYVSRVELEAQEMSSDAISQGLLVLEKQLLLNRHLLMVLSSRENADIPEFSIDQFHPPSNIPHELSASLIQQRPDVLIAEGQLRISMAQLGTAKSSRFPQFSLNLTSGGTAANIQQMFWNSGKFFELALSITQSVFDGGVLEHKQRAAEGVVDQNLALYRSSILLALQNVADSLHALQNDQESVAIMKKTANSTEKTVDLLSRQYKLGLTDRLVVLNAVQNNLLAQSNLVQIQAQRMGDLVALFQSLGGGWTKIND